MNDQCYRVEAQIYKTEHDNDLYLYFQTYGNQAAIYNQSNVGEFSEQ